jgi:glycosyltransferase involved in cell wall biosynthesis
MPLSIRTLHVGCVWPSERSGGADRVFADLAKYLPSNDVGVEGLVAGPTKVDASLAATISSFGEVTDGTRSRWLGARKAIAERLDSGQIDLFVSHFALYGSAAVGRLRRQPHVVHFQGPWAAESRQEGAGRLSALAKWSIERTVYRAADRLIVLSEAFATLLARDYGVPRARIRVVPGAADLKRFMVGESRAEARRALGWPDDRPILVCVRRLVNRTGVDRLIEAMPQVTSRVPGAMLFVAGIGRLKSQLEQRVKTLGLDDSVRFLGYVPDEQLPLLYRAADLNVMPTIALEAFGLSTVEALAAGTPSIVTPVGGLPEIVKPLSPGLVLASTGIDDIAEGTIAALSGRVPLPSDVECRSFATTHFSVELMARRVAAVYEEACA